MHSVSCLLQPSLHWKALFGWAYWHHSMSLWLLRECREKEHSCEHPAPKSSSSNDWWWLRITLLAQFTASADAPHSVCDRMHARLLHVCGCCCCCKCWWLDDVQMRHATQWELAWRAVEEERSHTGCRFRRQEKRATSNSKGSVPTRFCTVHLDSTSGFLFNWCQWSLLAVLHNGHYLPG